MFKKSLLAASIAAFSTGAFAVNVTSTALQHSNEGVQSAATIAGAAATATLNAEYKVDDLITFTYSQDISNTAATTINAVLVGAGAGDEMVLGKLSQDANSVTYRVTNLVLGNGATTTVGATVAIPAPTFAGADVRAAGSASVTYSATLSNGTTPLDQATAPNVATVDVVELVDQFTVDIDAATDFDGVVDVEDDRQSYEGGVAADTVVVELVNTAATDINAALTGVTFTVNGNFGFLDTDADTDGIQLGTNTVTASAGTVDSVAADAIVVSHNAAAAITITVTNNEANEIPTQTFTVDTEIAYDDTGDDGVAGGGDDVSQTANVAGTAAGEWTINGSNITFPYVPVGFTSTTTNFEIANSGVQNGDILLTAFDSAGNSYSGTASIQAVAGTVTKLSPTEIMSTLGLTSGTKLSLTITTTAPDADIKITGYSNFKDSGRNTLLSDTYEGM